VNIGDAALVEACGELVLGKAGPARGGDRTHVDQEFYAGSLQLIEHRFLRRLLIANGEERSRFARH
jgi:hypothetical protein